MHEIMYFLVQELDLAPSTGVILPAGLGLHAQDIITNNNNNDNKRKKPLFRNSCIILLELP